MIEIPTGDEGPREVEVATELPEALPVLPLADSVPYPDTLTPLAVGQERSVKLVNDVLVRATGCWRWSPRARATSRTPGPEDLYGVGVAGVVARMLKVPDGTLRILVQGSQRVGLGEFVQSEPYLVARIEPLPDIVVPSPELEALHRNVQAHLLADHRGGPVPARGAPGRGRQPRRPRRARAHDRRRRCGSSTEERQELLEERDVAKRLRRLSELLARELELISIGTRIQSQVESEMEKGQREYFLRQQLKAIQDELGEVDETQAEANELRERIEAANLPELRAQAGRARARALRAAAAAGRRARRDPHLPRVARRPAVVGRRPRTASTSRRRARSSTATTTTSRRSRTASSSSSRCAS